MFATNSGAIFSECGNYRYALWRVWDNKKRKVLFIGLNPATADEIQNDNTIARCIYYAKSWKFGGVLVGNLFAYRNTTPAGMKNAPEPVGLENDRWLLKLKNQADLVIAIWSNHGTFMGRNLQVSTLFPDVYCLAVTKAGHPHHTRGLANGLRPQPYHIKTGLPKKSNPDVRGSFSST